MISAVPERFGGEQAAQIPPGFRLTCDKAAVVPGQDDLAGAGDGGAVSAARQLGDDVLRGAHVIGIAQIVLQALQPCGKFFDRLRIVEAA